MIGQYRNVLATIPQWRKFQADHVEAVIQVLPESARPHGGLQVLVAGGDNANIHWNCLSGAHRPDLAFLKYSQEFHLKSKGHVANLIQKDGATVGGLKQSAMVVAGAGKSPFDMAKQFGFQQLLR